MSEVKRCKMERLVLTLSFSVGKKWGYLLV